MEYLSSLYPLIQILVLFLSVPLFFWLKYRGGLRGQYRDRDKNYRLRDYLLLGEFFTSSLKKYEVSCKCIYGGLDVFEHFDQRDTIPELNLYAHFNEEFKTFISSVHLAINEKDIERSKETLILEIRRFVENYFSQNFYLADLRKVEIEIRRR